MLAKPLDEESIFKVAAGIPSEEVRRDYLQQACGDDHALLNRVQRLLRAHAEAPSFLETPAADIAATLEAPPASHQPGQTIGRYKLLEQIGEGGMGVVYLAEQREPVRRKVALKIIKPGLDTREVIARFEAERQALAMMDHPNIAKVLDGGTTGGNSKSEVRNPKQIQNAKSESQNGSGDAVSDIAPSNLDLISDFELRYSDFPPRASDFSSPGRPYFVMELVQGLPITDHCDQANLTTQQRLALFISVCQAVQHAHQKGIIHRDIKPSNVLVTLHDGVPVPKVIDFGVAKAIHQPLTENTLFTGQGRMIGTPLYMSPEQAEMTGLDVDTRSDIYSLGVLLYELLTGSTPFDRDRLRQAGFDELRRVIREEDPPRPSHRVSTLAALAAEAISTVTAHRGVDARRLGRLLQGDLDWIVMKALQKDRSLRYESASALAADVQRYLVNEPVQARPPSRFHHAAKWVRRHRPLVGSVGTVAVVFAVTAGAIAWNGFRRAAALEKDVNGHLAAAAALVESADYAAAGREVAESRAHLETGGYGDGPLSEETQRIAGVLAAKSDSIKRLDEFQRLRHRIHSEMYALDRTILDQAQSHCRTALDLYGVMEGDSWKQQQGFADLSAEQQATLEAGVVELLFVWARLEIGRSDELPAAERPAGLRRSVETLARIQSFHSPIPAVYLWIADCQEAAGDKQAAAEARAKAQAMRPTTAMDHFLLGEHHAQHGRHNEALASYGQALAEQPDHYLALLASGVALGELKKYESAEAMLTGTIAMNPQTVFAFAKRGMSRLEQGKILLAQADFQQAKKLDPDLARALVQRAAEFNAKGVFDKALPECSEAIRIDPNSTWAYLTRASIYANQGALNKAIDDLNCAIRLDPRRLSAYYTRSCIYRNSGRHAEALADAEECIRLDRKAPSGYLARGWLASDRGEKDKALADVNEAVRLDPHNSTAYFARADVYVAFGEREKALADFDRVLQLAPTNAWAYMGRAAIHQEKGGFAKALADYNEAVRAGGPQYAIPYLHRARFHRNHGDFDKAADDYKQTFRADPTWTGVLACDELADMYRDKGDLAQAAAVYDQVKDFGSNPHLHRNRAELRFRMKRYAEALDDLAKLVELRPDMARSLLWIPPAQVANCPDERLRKGLLELAGKAIVKTKGAAESYAVRAQLYAAFAQPEKALADFNKALQLDPKNAVVWELRSFAHAQQSQWAEAAADLSKLVELAPENAQRGYLLALARLGGGHVDEYRKDCAAMLKRFGQTNQLEEANWTAWACVLAPNAAQDWPKVVALAEKAADSAKGDPRLPFYVGTLGAVLYRAGRFDEALKRLNEANRPNKDPSERWPYSPAYIWFFLGMSHHRLGHSAEAKKWFDKAVPWADNVLREAEQGATEVAWNRRLALKLLRDEAVALTKPAPANQAPKVDPKQPGPGPGQGQGPGSSEKPPAKPPAAKEKTEKAK